MEPRLLSAEWLLGGAAAGLAVDLSLFPLDTVKTRLQSSAGFRKSGAFSGLYRGMGSVALGSAPGAAAFFVTYEFVKAQLGAYSSPHVHAAAACCGELVACLVRVPTEIVKQRAQVSHHSSLSVAMDLARQRGLVSFYNGYLSTICREIPFAFIQYPMWEHLKAFLVARTGADKASPMQSATAGCVSGAVAAGLTTPLDVVKTRIMLGSAPSANPLLTLASILRTEGWRPLFSGFTPRCAWMGLGGYIYFFGYEATVALIRKLS